MQLKCAHCGIAFERQNPKGLPPKYCDACRVLVRKENSDRSRIKNSEKIRERGRRWRLTNPDKVKQFKQKYRGRNSEKIATAQKEYRARTGYQSGPAFRKWYLANRESQKQRSRQYYAAHKEELADGARIRANRTRAANLDRERERSRVWHQANKEYRREYVREHTQRYLVYARNRRARVNGAGSHTEEDIADLLKRQGGKCETCRCSLIIAGFHVDHIMPIKLGGSNDPSNLQLLCPPCNLRKNAKHPEDWAKENGRLF